MHRIDDLIRDIYKEEAPDLPGYIEKEQQIRIEARIMEAIQTEQEVEQRESGKEKVRPASVKYRPKRRFLAFGLAAVLLLGLCISAFANSNSDWDIEILQFMGLDESDTFQLESGEVKIQVFDSCAATEYDSEGNPFEKEVKIMAVNSIGDKNSACIRIETDYELPEGFDPATDYIMPEYYDVRVYENSGKSVVKDMGSTMGYIDDDGKLGFIIYIIGCEGINNSRIEVTFKDFYLHHDLGMKEGGKKEELLLSGEWELNWKFTYKSNVKRYKMLKQIEIDGVKYYITKIEMSPLSVQLDAFRMPWNRQEESEGFIVDSIRYKDGTSLDVGGFSSRGNRNGIFLDIFLGTTQIETTIDVDNIESIIVGGNEIILYY